MNAIGAFTGPQNPSLDDLVSKTIRKNLGDPSCAVGVGVDVGDNNEPIPNKSNPVPKPPRRGTNNGLNTAMVIASSSASPATAAATNANNYISNESGMEEPCYENLQSYHGGTTATHKFNTKDFIAPADPDIYASVSDVVIGRPVPPIPVDDCEDEFRKNNTSLTEEELSQLYATVDVVKRNAERMLKKTSNASSLLCGEGEGSKKREYQVSTVVDENGMVIEGIFKVKVDEAFSKLIFSSTLFWLNLLFLSMLIFLFSRIQLARWVHFIKFPYVTFFLTLRKIEIDNIIEPA